MGLVFPYSPKIFEKNRLTLVRLNLSMNYLMTNYK
jgi:hypothetical protein